MSHWPTLKFSIFVYVSGMAAAIDFKFATQIAHMQYYPQTQM